MLLAAPRTSTSFFLARLSLSLASSSIKPLDLTYLSLSVRYRLEFFSVSNAFSISTFVAPVFLRREIVSILPLIKRSKTIIAMPGKIFLIM